MNDSANQQIYNHFKDEVLNRLGQEANIAQFVSFDPQLEQRFSLIRGFERNTIFPTVESAAEAILRAAPENLVNIRSYTPDNPKSREFVFKLKTVEDVVSNLKRLSSEGLYTIVNETIDEKDGGVSGVAVGNVIEFAPDDIPRAVEKAGTAAFPRKIGLEFLNTIYGFQPALDYPSNVRVEFSIHPLRRGYRNEHTTIWELEDVGENDFSVIPSFPNNFSRKIGDKAFGLLLASLYGFDVPRTTVIPRAIAPFSYGKATGTNEIWIRTCPKEPIPGFFTTQRGWTDPYKLLAAEDTENGAIASVLAQEGIEAEYSGALVTDENAIPIIEGVKGFGEDFMLGDAEKENLPEYVLHKVENLFDKLKNLFGAIRMEWVFDGEKVWIVQMHIGATSTSSRFIYPGEPDKYHYFDTSQGISKLRELILDLKDTNDGIILRGNVGITSHFGDVLRKAGIPSKIEPVV